MTSEANTAPERAVFVGSKAIGLKSLRALHEAVGNQLVGVITFDDSGDTRSVLPEFQEMADSAGQPLLVLKDRSDLPDALEQLEPSAVFVVGWYWLISPELINLVPRGIVGMHASMLPDLRGSAPLVWAMLTRRAATGISMFYFDAGMDTGDIVDQRPIPIRDGDTIADLVDRSERAAVEMMRVHAAAVLAGTAPRRPQDHAGATYGTIRRPADGKIDWDRTTDEIITWVRAQTRPYPGAFTRRNESTIRVWAASRFGPPLYGIPGVVVQINDGRPVVATADGAVILEEYEMENQARAGGPLRVGNRLS